MSKKRWMLAALGVGALALVLLGAACSSSSKKGTATKTPARTAARATTTPTRANTTPAGGTPATSTSGASGATLKVTQNASLGAIVTDAQGMTLYTFDSDTAGASNCNAGCTPTWPPLTTTGTPTAGSGITGTVGTIQRSDGTTQVTLGGKPLYHFAGDTAPGDTKGDGILNLWHAAKPG